MNAATPPVERRDTVLVQRIMMEPDAWGQLLLHVGAIDERDYENYPELAQTFDEIHLEMTGYRLL